MPAESALTPIRYYLEGLHFWTTLSLCAALHIWFHIAVAVSKLTRRQRGTSAWCLQLSRGRRDVGKEKKKGIMTSRALHWQGSPAQTGGAAGSRDQVEFDHIYRYWEDIALVYPTPVGLRRLHTNVKEMFPGSRSLGA